MLAVPAFKHLFPPMNRRADAPARRHESLAAGLARRGYQVEQLNEEQLKRTGQAVFKVVGKRGPATGRAIHSDQVDRDFCGNVLKHMALFHPHIAAPTGLARVGQYLCFFVNESSGGGLHAMVRRGGEGGLPTCAAVYMAQQIAAIADFMHRFGLYLHELSPAALQVSWGDSGLPLVMVETLQLPSEAVVPGGKATLHTCPAAIRVAAQANNAAGADVAASEAFKVACDVWAFAVALYFMLFGRFPFAREQFGAWAGQAADEWNDDVHVTYTKAFGAPVDPEIATWLKAVFAAGRLPAADFAARFSSMHALFAQPWLVRDLPEGVRGMNKQYQANTEARRASREFQELAKAFGLVVEPGLADNPADPEMSDDTIEPAAHGQADSPAADATSGQPAAVLEPAAAAEPAAEGEADATAATAPTIYSRECLTACESGAAAAAADSGDPRATPAPAGAAHQESCEESSTDEGDASGPCVQSESGCAQRDVGEVPGKEAEMPCAGLGGCGRADGTGEGREWAVARVPARPPAAWLAMAFAIMHVMTALCSGCSIGVASGTPKVALPAPKRKTHGVLQAGRLTWETRAFSGLCRPVLCVFIVAAMVGWATQPGQSDLGSSDLA